MAGMALLGCEVVVTDQAEVLPLLRRNMERNMAQAKYSALEYSHLGTMQNLFPHFKITHYFANFSF